MRVFAVVMNIILGLRGDGTVVVGYMRVHVYTKCHSDTDRLQSTPIGW